MLTVLTWLWTQPGGRTRYTVEHVAVWAHMVRRNLRMPHRIACVTDERSLPAGVDRIHPPGDFEDVTSSRWGNGRPNCFRRLSMFRTDAGEIFGERFVCMDLDVVIGGPLDPLFDTKADLKLFRGTAPTRPYNGSMMLIRAGCRPQVFEKFNQRGADKAGEKFMGSDQAWLAKILGWRERTWDERDGVYFYGPRYQREKPNPRALFFPGKLKPWTLAKVRADPFITNNYRVEAREAA